MEGVTCSNDALIALMNQQEPNHLVQAEILSALSFLLLERLLKIKIKSVSIVFTPVSGEAHCGLYHFNPVLGSLTAEAVSTNEGQDSRRKLIFVILQTENEEVVYSCQSKRAPLWKVPKHVQKYLQPSIFLTFSTLAPQFLDTERDTSKSLRNNPIDVPIVMPFPKKDLVTLNNQLSINVTHT